MPLRPRTLSPVVLLASLSLAPAARADAPSSHGDDARAQADDEFSEGKKLMEAGDTAAACVKFAHSQELDPKLGRLLNLAFCHEQEGLTASAWAEFNGAAALAEEKGQAERVDFAREHAAAVAKKLAFVHLDIPANAASVDVDGATLSHDRWPMPLPFDPGEHHVVARAPGKKTRDVVVVVGTTPGIQEFRIAALEDEETPATPPPVQAPAPRPPIQAAPPPEHAGPSRVPAVIVTGVATGGFAVGAVFGLQAISKKSSADPDCPAKLCNAEGSRLISQAETAATVSTIGFSVGLASAAVAAWLFVRRPSEEKGAARLVPVVGPGVSGLAMEGSW